MMLSLGLDKISHALLIELLVLVMLLEGSLGLEIELLHLIVFLEDLELALGALAGGLGLGVEPLPI